MARLTRPSWDEWGLALAKAVSSRADCSRRQVGAVLLSSQRRVISSGYNGSAPGSDLSCLKGDCPRARSGVMPGSSYDSGAGSCLATHAEMNCLLFSDFSLRSGAVMYITDYPCDGCWKVLNASGISCVVWPGGSADL